MAKEKNKKQEIKETPSKYAGVLKNPRVTEKSNVLTQSNVYTFEVFEGATKPEIVKAVKDLHKVTPLRINIVNHPDKKISVRGKKSFKTGIKKAYVYLKKGDTIKS